MGKKKLAIIDDSVQEEVKEKPFKKKKVVKSESTEATESVIASPEGAKQFSPDEHPTKIAAATPDGGPRNDDKKKAQKPGKAKPRSKKYQELIKDLDRSKSYPLSEAVDMVKKLNYAKFNATIEAHINTVASGIRGLVSLPYASGKKLRILAFGPSTSLGVKSGADEGVILGDDSTIEEINKGKINFDLLVSTPEWMPKLAKVARILGPRGLMPNPKNGTITEDLKKAVEGFQGGKTEYKTEPKAPVIHLGLGKLDQPTEELSANVKILLQTVGKTRIKKVTLSPTMGPSVKVDLSSL